MKNSKRMKMKLYNIEYKKLSHIECTIERWVAAKREYRRKIKNG